MKNRSYIRRKLTHLYHNGRISFTLIWDLTVDVCCLSDHRDPVLEQPAILEANLLLVILNTDVSQ